MAECDRLWRCRQIAEVTAEVARELQEQADEIRLHVQGQDARRKGIRRSRQRANVLELASRLLTRTTTRDQNP